MAEQEQNPAGADAPAGTGTAAPSTQPDKPADAGQPEVWRNVDEIKKALAEVNALKGQLRDTLGRTPGGSKDVPAPAPAPAVPDPVAELRAEMALKDAVADAGLGQHRKRIEKLWRAEKPPDVEAWIKSTAAEMGWSAPAGHAPQVPPTETPPPSAGSSRSISSHPSALTKEQIDGMSDAELKAHWEAFKKSSGHFVHPGAAHKRERMQSNGVGEQIGRAITDALNRR